MTPFTFTIDQFPDFLRGYVQNAGNLNRIKLHRFPSATRQWVKELRREHGLSDADLVRTMCLGHANRLLPPDGPALEPMCAGGDPMKTVTCAWMHALAFESFDTALNACFAMFVAHAGEGGATRAREHARQLVALAADLLALNDVMERADATFLRAREAYHSGIKAVVTVAAAEQPDDPDFARLAALDGDQLAGQCKTPEYARATEVARAVVPAVDSLLASSARMFGEYNSAMEQALAARGRVTDRARTLLPGIGRHMLCRAALAAYDHLGLAELQPWLTLLQLGAEQASDDPRDDAQRLLLECMVGSAQGSLEERRSASWRQSMLDDDARTVAEMVREYNAQAATLDANLADLLGADEPPQARRKKAKARARARARAKATAAAEEEPDRDGPPATTEAAAEEPDPDEPEECVVCLDAAATVRIAACGHTLMCEACAAAWRQCPYCRA